MTELPAGCFVPTTFRLGWSIHSGCLATSTGWVKRMRQPPTYIMPEPTMRCAVGVDRDEVAIVGRAGGADDVDGLQSQRLARDNGLFVDVGLEGDAALLCNEGSVLPCPVKTNTCSVASHGMAPSGFVCTDPRYWSHVSALLVGVDPDRLLADWGVLFELEDKAAPLERDPGETIDTHLGPFCAPSRMVSVTDFLRAAIDAGSGREDERVGVVAQPDILGLVEVASAEERRAGGDLHGAERLVKGASCGVSGKPDAAGLRIFDRCEIVEDALGGAEQMRIGGAENCAAGERDGTLGEAKGEVG